MVTCHLHKKTKPVKAQAWSGKGSQGPTLSLSAFGKLIAVERGVAAGSLFNLGDDGVAPM